MHTLYHKMHILYQPIIASDPQEIDRRKSTSARRISQSTDAESPPGPRSEKSDLPANQRRFVRRREPIAHARHGRRPAYDWLIICVFACADHEIGGRTIEKGCSEAACKKREAGVRDQRTVCDSPNLVGAGAARWRPD